MTDMVDADAGSKKRLQTWIFNPFHFLAGGQALALGLAFIFAAGLLGWTVNGHLDGVLDFHVGRQAPVWLFLAEGFIDWLSLALVLWGAALLLSKTRYRVLDVFGTQALARVPALLTMGAACLPGFQTQAMRLAAGNFAIIPAEMAAFIVGMLLTVAFVIWMIILMYRGFAVSCNVSGGKAIGAFIVALLVAEVISKAAIIGLVLVAI